MKKLLACLIWVWLPTAYAVDFEVAAGIAAHQKMPNGWWYQEGLPHKLKLSAPSLQIGLTGDIVSNLAWHADYVYLGKTRSDAIATSDENYNLQTKACDGQCHYKSRFIGSGDIHGVKLSLEPYVMWRGIRFGVEGGVFAFRSRWAVTLINRPMENGYVDTGAVTVRHDARIHITPMIGASIGYRDVSIAYQYFRTESRNRDMADDFAPLSRSAHVIMMRYRF